MGIRSFLRGGDPEPIYANRPDLANHPGRSGTREAHQSRAISENERRMTDWRLEDRQSAEERKKWYG